MALSELDRARIILDLLKDGTVANEAAYANCDKIDAVTATKYIEQFWNHPAGVAPPIYPTQDPDDPNFGQTIPFAEATNAQKAELILGVLRKFIANHYATWKSKDAAITEGDTVRTASQAEAATDLGS